VVEEAAGGTAAVQRYVERFSVRCRLFDDETAHPTTYLEKRSMIAARDRQPSLVTSSVVSPTYFASRCVAE
jgi:hypothetical protein